MMCAAVCLQLVGVNFLMLLKRSGIQGSILADEMGLGKTAQAICFLGGFCTFEVCQWCSSIRYHEEQLFYMSLVLGSGNIAGIALHVKCGTQKPPQATVYD